MRDGQAGLGHPPWRGGGVLVSAASLKALTPQAAPTIRGPSRHLLVFQISRNLAFYELWSKLLKGGYSIGDCIGEYYGAY